MGCVGFLFHCMCNIFMQVKTPHLQTRFSHSATAFGLGPGIVEVTVFGGCSEWTKMIAVDMVYLTNTTLLRFGKDYHSLHKVVDYRYSSTNIIRACVQWW